MQSVQTLAELATWLRTFGAELRIPQVPVERPHKPPAWLCHRRDCDGNPRPQNRKGEEVKG